MVLCCCGGSAWVSVFSFALLTVECFLDFGHGPRRAPLGLLARLGAFFPQLVPLAGNMPVRHCVPPFAVHGTDMERHEDPERRPLLAVPTPEPQPSSASIDV
jgi:hypothetical protein